MSNKMQRYTVYLEAALHVDQFPDKINCVTLHLVGHILEYSYDTRTHEC